VFAAGVPEIFIVYYQCNSAIAAVSALIYWRLSSSIGVLGQLHAGLAREANRPVIRQAPKKGASRHSRETFSPKRRRVTGCGLPPIR
jgi:hypothetical protein